MPRGLHLDPQNSHRAAAGAGDGAAICSACKPSLGLFEHYADLACQQLLEMHLPPLVHPGKSSRRRPGGGRKRCSHTLAYVFDRGSCT